MHDVVADVVPDVAATVAVRFVADVPPQADGNATFIETMAAFKAVAVAVALAVTVTVAAIVGVVKKVAIQTHTVSQ